MQVKRWLGMALVAGVSFGAAALDVDYDYHLLVLEDFVGDTIPLRGVDGDGNGIWEEAQLAMVSALLAGGARLDTCVDAAAVTAVQDNYDANLAQVETDLVATVSLPFPLGDKTYHIIEELETTDPVLAAALQHVIAGMMTCADEVTVTYINTVVDAAVEKAMEGVLGEDNIADVQQQIDLQSADYATFGDAGMSPNYLGAQGDVDGDTETNLTEYTSVEGDREAWLTACCMVPTLRIAALSGGGVELSGAQHTFSVTAAGTDTAVSYEWRKGTVAESTVVASTQVFTIDFLNKSDQGKYFCVFSDGATSCTTPLLALTVVETPLLITRQIQGGTRQQGASITFSVEVQGGSPGPYVYAWYYYGQADEQLLADANTSSLTLSEVTAADAGDYKVTVTSNGGADIQTSGPVTLTVTEPVLVISQQPQGGLAPVAGEYTFSIGVTGGSGQYSYDWQKEGVSLSAPDQSTLVLNNLATTDAGLYRCLVSDTVNEGLSLLSDEVRLSVGDPLSITQQPAAVEKELGVAHTFTVNVAGGSGEYTYDWRKDGVSLSAPSQNTFTIDPVAMESAGAYSCHIVDAHDSTLSITSMPAQLILSIAPLRFFEQPAGAEKEVGDALTLSVLVQGGSGEYQYDWQKDGVSLSAPDQSTLVFDSLTLEDDGVYTCVVQDVQQEGVSLTSAGAVVGVSDPNQLVVTQQPVGASLYEGASHTFIIRVTGGSGEYSYEWRKDGVPVTGADAILYRILNLKTTHSGAYCCYVTDVQNSQIQVVTDTVTLTVSTQLSITDNPASGAYWIGERVRLQVGVSGGIEPLTYTWKKAGEAISLVPNLPELDLGNVGRMEQGAYTCAITDAADNTVESAVAEIVVQPYLLSSEGASFDITLSSDRVIPANEGAVLTATASGTLTLAGLIPQQGSILEFRLSHTLLDALRLELRAGGPRENGKLLVDLGSPLMNNNKTISSDITSYILTGNAYLLITSQSYPDGAVRQQLFPSINVFHTADQNQDKVIQMSELLRLIQFYNSDGFHCDEVSEDGYAPRSVADSQECLVHDSDYAPTDWKISLSELLRLIQFFNSQQGVYHTCIESEDLFCPGE